MSKTYTTKLENGTTVRVRATGGYYVFVDGQRQVGPFLKQDDAKKEAAKIRKRRIANGTPKSSTKVSVRRVKEDM